MASIIIDKRYCGPPNSGNGGYVCGRLARHIPGGAEITLRAPPPLEKPLDVVAMDDGQWQLRDGAAVVATGKAASVELARLEKASFDEASAAELLTPVKPHEHLLPTCFVCGPARRPGDGLRIFAGPRARQTRDASPVLAATWTPDRSRLNFSGRRSTVPAAMPLLTIRRAVDGTACQYYWGVWRRGSKPGHGPENDASLRPGRPVATAANAWQRPPPMAKPEDCWPSLARRGSLSTVRCSLGRPEANACGARRRQA
jgi:hypothetical protein